MSRVSAEFFAGFVQGSRRLRSFVALAAVSAAVALCAIFAYAYRLSDAFRAVDLSLQGVGFGVAVPLSSMAFVAIILQSGSVQTASNALAVMGANRRLVALSLMAVAWLGCSLSAAVIAGITATVAYGAAFSGAISDIFTTIWIGALAGLVYGAYFTMASGFGKKGGARWLALFADWILGLFGGAVGVIVPKMHIMNLLGVQTVQWCSQRAGTVILAVMAVMFAVVLALRVKP